MKSLSLVMLFLFVHIFVACADVRTPTSSVTSEAVTEPTVDLAGQAGGSTVVEPATTSSAGGVQNATPLASLAPTGETESGRMSGLSWLLVLLNGDPPLPGTSITAVFGSSNTLGGWAGCNSYAASIQVEGEAMVISQPAATPQTCGKPVMEQETRYLDALTEVANYTIRDDELVMYDDRGEMVALFHPLTPIALPGTTWQVIAYNRGAQELVGVIEGTEIRLAFGEDGLLTGTAGCNDVTATYLLDGQDLSIELNGDETNPADIVCLEPIGVMTQEQQFNAALEKIVTYQITGSTLILRAADEAMLVLLAQSEVIPPVVEITPSNLIDIAGNATYRLAHVAEEPITLRDGRYPADEDGEAADGIVVTLSEYVTFGQLRSGENAAAVVLITDRGFGVPRYDLAILNLELEQPRHVATVFLDDRIELEALAIEDGQIVVDIIAQGPDDPLCCPTLPVKLTYLLRGNELVQTTRQATEQATDTNGIAGQVDGPIEAVGQEIDSDPLAGFTASSEGIYLRLHGVATSYFWQLVFAKPYDDCCAPTPTGLPTHLVVTFNGQAPSAAIDEGGPILYALPISSYQALWASNGDETIINQVDQLKRLLQQRPSIIEKPLPLLPPIGLTNTVATATQYVNMESGSGIRYVGVFGDIQGPLVNGDLHYYFQGLTEDGQFYVSLIFPVSAWFLPNTRNEVPPAEQAEFDRDPEAYITATLEQLSTLALSEWTPGLDKLDAMIESLRISP